MTAFDLITQALDAVGRKRGQRDGSGWLYSCPGPSHTNGDRNPSLSVRPGSARDGRGRAWVKCYAGCTDAEVLNSLGLRIAHLYDVRKDGARHGG